MRISEERRKALYNAIHDPVTNLRVEIEMQKRSIMDEDLHDLVHDIWLVVKEVLDIKDT